MSINKGKGKSKMIKKSAITMNDLGVETEGEKLTLKEFHFTQIRPSAEEPKLLQDFSKEKRERVLY